MAWLSGVLKALVIQSAATVGKHRPRPIFSFGAVCNSKVWKIDAFSWVFMWFWGCTACKASVVYWTCNEDWQNSSLFIFYCKYVLSVYVQLPLWMGGVIKIYIMTVSCKTMVARQSCLCVLKCLLCLIGFLYVIQDGFCSLNTCLWSFW